MKANGWAASLQGRETGKIQGVDVGVAARKREMTTNTLDPGSAKKGEQESVEDGTKSYMKRTEQPADKNAGKKEKSDSGCRIEEAVVPKVSSIGAGTMSCDGNVKKGASKDERSDDLGGTAQGGVT